VDIADKVTEKNSIKQFQENGYAVIQNLVDLSICSFLYEYALKGAQFGKLSSGDDAVPETPCRYADPFMETLLEMLHPRVEKEVGTQLYPTYSYFRVYKNGDILTRHKDRPSCEVSVSLNLGYKAVEPWPIWVEHAGVSTGIPLAQGGALIYRGTEVTHWRERYEGEHAVQVFLHYVAQSGPNQEWKFDKREGLAIPPLTRQILEQLRSAI